MSPASSKKLRMPGHNTRVLGIINYVHQFGILIISLDSSSMIIKFTRYSTVEVRLQSGVIKFKPLDISPVLSSQGIAHYLITIGEFICDLKLYILGFSGDPPHCILCKTHHLAGSNGHTVKLRQASTVCGGSAAMAQR